MDAQTFAKEATDQAKAIKVVFPSREVADAKDLDTRWKTVATLQHTHVTHMVQVVRKQVSCTAQYATCDGNSQQEFAMKAEADLEGPPSSPSESDQLPEI